MYIYSDPSREDVPHALPDVEVWYHDGIVKMWSGNVLLNHARGWYWWSCFPGCLPDGDAHGPFDTEAEAISNVREEMEV